MNRLALCSLVLAIGIASDSVLAQRAGGRWFGPNHTIYAGAAGHGIVAGQGVGAYGAFGGGWYPGGYNFGATTAIESAQRGMADVIRAQGEANESQARAQLKYEEARSSYLDNEEKWRGIRNERRRDAQSRRNERFAKKRESRERYAASRSRRTPQRSSPSELDPTTGDVNWPEALQTVAFDEHRAELDELFALRAHAGNSQDLRTEIHDAARHMKTTLKGFIDELETTEYIDARKFIDRLDMAGRLGDG